MDRHSNIADGLENEENTPGDTINVLQHSTDEDEAAWQLIEAAEQWGLLRYGEPPSVPSSSARL